MSSNTLSFCGNQDVLNIQRVCVSVCKLSEAKANACVFSVLYCVNSACVCVSECVLTFNGFIVISYRETSKLLSNRLCSDYLSLMKQTQAHAPAFCNRSQTHKAHTISYIIYKWAQSIRLLRLLNRMVCNSMMPKVLIYVVIQSIHIHIHTSDMFHFL